MKEWALKHPWMTFFLVSSAIEGIVSLVSVLVGNGTDSTETKEDEESEKSVETEEEA